MSTLPVRLLSLLAVLFTLVVGSWAYADNDRDRDNGRGNSDKRAGLTVPVTGFGKDPLTGARTGASFEGTFTIERFARAGADAVAVGLLKGVVTNASGAKGTIVQNIALPVAQGKEPVMLSGQPSSAPARDGTAVAGGLMKVHNTPVNMMKVQVGSCNILNLVLGPLDLNLLGLVIELNQVVLNITGQTGPGNLLGNLLCGITGLLNGPLTLGQLITLIGLLNQLLAILAGL